MKTHATTAMFAAMIAVVSTVPAGCSRRDDAAASAAPPAARVRVSEARAVDEMRRVELPGTVRAVESAQLAPKIMGDVESIPVTLGQRVKRGDVLAKISAGEINARLSQAEAGLSQATRDMERERALLARDASTAETVRNLEDRRRIVQATVDEARAMLGYTAIAAPFDGVVIQKFASEGDLAAPGRPLLAVENPARLRVETDVPESLVRMAAGSAVTVQIAGREVYGRLAELAPASDAATRMFTAKIDLPAGADAGAHPGQFARVAWPSGETSVVLVVPEPAVSLFGQMERVFVADGAGRASLRLVRTGTRRGGAVEIVSGLSAGEKVVVEGAGTLRDGQLLEVLP